MNANTGIAIHLRGVGETLTHKEALVLEAIGRGENVCARIGKEDSRSVGGRRRAVTNLRAKGYIAPIGKATQAAEWASWWAAKSGERLPTLHEHMASIAPTLTDAGRKWVAGRAAEIDNT